MMSAAEPPLVADPELVTPEWLTDVLRHGDAIGDDTKVTSFTSTSIGTGQVGANVRYTLTYEGKAGPDSIVCKFSSRDPQSASTGVSTLTYETEVAFYRDLAHTVEISRPHCYLAALESGTANVVLVMEDLSPAEQGDQITGCTVEQATLAVDEAARLHGPRWGDPTLTELAWLDRRSTQGGLASMLEMIWGAFVDRYRATLEPVAIEAGAQLIALVPKLGEHAPAALTPIHYDYRLDNMLFGTPAGGRVLTVVDWQTVQLGLGPQDVAYFLGNAFPAEVRRTCERDLVQRYHRALVDDYGVDDYPFDECWSDYVRSSYASLSMAIFASMMVGRTDRGDEMFMAMANRSAQMAADLDAPSVITNG
jgi:hypothetical protein